MCTIKITTLVWYRFKTYLKTRAIFFLLRYFWSKSSSAATLLLPLLLPSVKLLHPSSLTHSIPRHLSYTFTTGASETPHQQKCLQENVFIDEREVETKCLELCNYCSCHWHGKRGCGLICKVDLGNKIVNKILVEFSSYYCALTCKDGV